jgi:hypothetical protein
VKQEAVLIAILTEQWLVMTQTLPFATARLLR